MTLHNTEGKGGEFCVGLVTSTDWQIDRSIERSSLVRTASSYNQNRIFMPSIPMQAGPANTPQNSTFMPSGEGARRSHVPLLPLPHRRGFAIALQQQATQHSLVTA